MNRNIFGWEEQGCFNENTLEALWVLGFVVFQNPLNIIVKYFCLFLGINNFEVINVFHTSCKHFSMSCTQWILVILKAKTQILEPKIACADDAWGFFFPCIWIIFFNYSKYRNDVVFQFFLGFVLVKIKCWRYHILPDTQNLFSSLTCSFLHLFVSFLRGTDVISGLWKPPFENQFRKN